jgi:hypothetical protein
VSSPGLTGTHYPKTPAFHRAAAAYRILRFLGG